MSRNPGIGYAAVAKLVAFHETKAGIISLQKNRDVQGLIRYGKTIKPLGRYIVRKTREALGVPHSDPDRPSHLATLSEEERILRDKKRDVSAIRAQRKPIRKL